MGAQYKPVKGDRVRVVLEGEVDSTFANGDFDLGRSIGWTNSIRPTDETVVSIEKIEPPVEVFKPGDVVRSKANPGLLYSIGRDGYLSHSLHEFFGWYPTGATHREAFTSRYYEKVSLG